MDIIIFSLAAIFVLIVLFTLIFAPIGLLVSWLDEQKSVREMSRPIAEPPVKFDFSVEDNLVSEREVRAWKLWPLPCPTPEEAQELFKKGEITQERVDRLSFQSACRSYYMENGQAPNMEWETKWWVDYEAKKLAAFKEWKTTQPTPKQTQKLERNVWGVTWTGI